MKWLEGLRKKIEAGESLDKDTALWLLRAIEWQHGQMQYAFDAILTSCDSHATGPSGEEVWYSDSDAESFMNPRPFNHPNIDRGPPHESK